MTEPQAAFSDHDVVVGRARIPASALRWQFSRSGGPGGQNVNKVSSRAEVWVPLGAIEGLDDGARGRLRNLAGRRLTAADELHLTDEHSRSQRDNQQGVIERLSDMLRQALVAPKPRRKTKPSRGARERRLEHKKRRSQIKAGRRGEEG